MIAQGKYDAVKYLDDYYKGDKGLKAQVEKQEDKIDPQEAKVLNLPIEGLNGTNVHIGRFGPYIKTEIDGEDLTTSLPNEMDPGELSPDNIKEILQAEKDGPKCLGSHPETGEAVYVLKGRDGPDVQKGDDTEESKKRKRGSLLKGMKPADGDFEP